MGNDVLWSRYLNELNTARPSGLIITSMTMSVTGVQPGGPGKDILTPSGIGTIQINGVSPKYEQVAAWLERLDKIGGMSLPSLGTATAIDGGVQFTSGAVIDTKALSGRYLKKAG
jgi:hypothetical protein